MNVSLPPELEAMVRERLASGLYRDETQVITVALALLTDRDQAKLAALKAAVDAGRADIEAGRFVDIDTEEDLEAFIAEL